MIDIRLVVLGQQEARGQIQAQHQRIDRARTEHVLVVNQCVVSAIVQVIAVSGHLRGVLRVRFVQVIVAIAIPQGKPIHVGQPLIEPGVELPYIVLPDGLCQIVPDRARQVRQRVHRQHLGGQRIGQRGRNLVAGERRLRVRIDHRRAQRGKIAGAFGRGRNRGQLAQTRALPQGIVADEHKRAVLDQPAPSPAAELVPHIFRLAAAVEEITRV